MRRLNLSVLGGATLAALFATTTTAVPAGAAPPAEGPDAAPRAAAAQKKDNRPDALASARAAEKDKAIRKVLAGKAQVEQQVSAPPERSERGERRPRRGSDASA